MFDEGLDEIVRSVMRSGGSAFIALLEREFDVVTVYVKCGLVFEQTFIDRAEFLHVEGGIVHADELVVFRVFVDVERTEAAEKNVVAESASGEVPDGIAVEKISGEGSDAQFLAGSISFEEPEGGAAGTARDHGGGDRQGNGARRAGAGDGRCSSCDRYPAAVYQPLAERRDRALR